MTTDHKVGGSTPSGRGCFKKYYPEDKKIRNFISGDIERFGLSQTACLIVLLYPVLLLLNSFYWMIINYKPFYVQLITKEHYPVESITFITILASIFVGIKLVRLMYKRAVEGYKTVFISLVVIGLIFVGLEEISWGQWFFYFNSPDYFRDTNLQRETNIHNLRDLHVIFEYIRVIIGAGGLISIFLNRTSAFKYISSPSILIVSFLVITVFSAIDVYNFYLPDQRLLFRVGGFYWFLKFNMEIVELMIAISAFVFLFSNLERLRRDA